MNVKTIADSAKSELSWFGIKWVDLRKMIDLDLVDRFLENPTTENADRVLLAWVRFRQGASGL